MLDSILAGPIFVLPFGDVPGAVSAFVAGKIEERLGRSADVLDPVAVPEETFVPGRSQYSSTLMLKCILALAPEGASRIVGLTDVDLCTPVLSCVFGQAQFGGRAAVVSTRRLCQEYYGLPHNDAVLLERLGKEVVHELGHTCGMVHCQERRCVMHFSNSITEVDAKRDAFCSSCARLASAGL